MPRRPRLRFHIHNRLLGLLFLAVAVVYLAGNRSVPLWDRDEPRYAQTSRQMLESGDWILPRFLDEPRLKKPPLIYWFQASAMRLLGREGDSGVFAARLPSVIAMLATGGAMYLFARRTIGRRRAMLTTLILLTSGLAIGAAKMCLTDSVQLLWITIAQICFYDIAVRRRAGWKMSTAFGISLGLGVLTKGVAPGFIVITGIVLFVMRWIDGRKNASSASPNSNGQAGFARIAIFVVLALLLAAAIAYPWFAAMERRIPGYLKSAFSKEIVDRARSGQEGHAAPPGYYLLSVFATYFPWSLILPGALIYAWKHRRSSLTRFALAAVIGPWLLVEVVSTKLPHYLLPVFPWMALLTARFIISASRAGRAELRNRLFVRITGGWSILVVLLAAGPIAVTWASSDAGAIMWFAAVATLLVGAEYARGVFVAVRAGKPTFAAALMGGGMLAIVFVAYGGWLPRVSAIATSRRTADVMRDDNRDTSGAVMPARAGDAIMIDYKEPSLAFYQGGTIREESSRIYLQTTDPLLWPRWIVMTEDVWRAAPSDRTALLERVGEVDGWWYPNKGVRAHVVVARKR